MQQGHQDKSVEQRTADTIKELVRQKCTEKNKLLATITNEERSTVSERAEAYTAAIISSDAIMQIMIAHQMNNNPPQLLTPSSSPIPSMGNIQEALLSAVDLGFRVALQHDLMHAEVHTMSYNHCRFRVPTPSEIEQPKN